MPMRAWIALPLLAVAGFARAALCTPDAVPAATLLVPYFETCEDCFAPLRDSRIAVFNTGAAPRLARVTLWSNAAVPVFAFDVYLQGYAQQEFSVHALLRDGTLPVTGRGVSAPGLQAEPEVDFPGCNAGADPAGGSPVYAPLDVAARTAVRDALRGQPVGGLCSAVDDEPQTISGYATVDLVDRCNAPRAGQPGFADALVEANALGGRVLITDQLQNFEQAVAAVAIEAADAGQLDARTTFYNSGDRREPLPAAWALHAPEGGIYSENSELLVWRDPGTVQAPFACGSPPAWYPLGFSNREGWGSKGTFTVTDEGEPLRLRAERQFPLATQRKRPALERSWEVPAQGALYFNLQHLGGRQAWVGQFTGISGRFSSVQAATALDSGCDGAAFDNPSPAVAAPLPGGP
jgi:hypothetical protein